MEVTTHMAAHPYAAQLTAYQTAATHGGVAAADPHKLIVLLLDGALERIAGARGCIERADLQGKAHLLNRATQIVGELQASLNLSAGGGLAVNLAQLYDFVVRQLLTASLKNQVEPLDDAANVLHQIRDAWISIPQPARAGNVVAR